MIFAILIVLAALLLGGLGYQAGLEQGLAATADGARAAAPYGYGHPYGFGLGLGFGFLGLLFPILFLFLIFGLIRAAFGGPRWSRSGHWGPHGAFEDWHRQAHGETPPARRPGGDASSSTT